MKTTVRILYAVDKKTKPVFFAIQVKELEGKATIISATGQVGGKVTFKSKVVLDGKNIGKSNETLPITQATTEMFSKIHEVEKKGYKKRELYNKIYEGINLDTSDVEEIEEIQYYFVKQKSNITGFFLTNNIRTNTFKDGTGMPMLAQTYKPNKQDITYWFMQRKLNGVRCLASLVNGEVHLHSRGGIRYIVPHITKQLSHLLKDSTKIKLDGELFIKGYSLQNIVSLVKNEAKEERELLEYHIYDAAIDIKQIDRMRLLIKLSTAYYDKIEFVETIRVGSRERLASFEAKVIEEGYEGVILRNPDAYYAGGFRSENLLKVKQFIDEEFKVTSGYCKTEGDIDTFVFTLIQEEGKLFTARPRGSREVKQGYLDNINEIVGKKATVKYQERTENNIPHQGHVVIIRDYE